MFTHPDVALDLARLRADELQEQAAHERLARRQERRGRQRRLARQKSRRRAAS